MSANYYLGKVTVDGIEYNRYKGDGSDNNITASFSEDNYIGAQEGDDVIHGGNANDIIFGGTGHDTGYLYKGFDLAFFNDGNDVVFALDGDKTIYTGSGDDQFYGNKAVTGTITLGLKDGDDYAVLGGDSATVFANTGNDHIDTGIAKYVKAFLGEGDDQITVGAPTADGEVNTGPGTDTVKSLGGHIDWMDFTSGDDAIQFGDGAENRFTGFDTKLPDGMTASLTDDGLLISKGSASVTLVGYGQAELDLLLQDDTPTTEDPTTDDTSSDVSFMAVFTIGNYDYLL